MMGDDITLQVIEVDQERRRLIFSEKAAVHETRDSVRDQVIEKLEVGDVCSGRVTSLADFGAFVNINGADGLVHLSEISWDKVRHPGDELKVGQELEVKVISIDEEKKHIGLSIRRLKDDPWQESIKALRVGQLVEAKITRLTKFGAFAMLESGIEGLIHISEISDEHIGHPKELLHENDTVTLRVIKIETDSHRIGLSLRRVESLAFADMDMKVLEKELEGTDIKVVAGDEPAAADNEAQPAEEPASGEEESTQAPEAVSEEAPAGELAPDEAESAPAADDESEDIPAEEVAGQLPDEGTQAETGDAPAETADSAAGEQNDTDENPQA